MRTPLTFRTVVIVQVALTAALAGPAVYGQRAKTTVKEPLLFDEELALQGGDGSDLAYPPEIGGTEIVNERFPTGEIRVERQVRLDADHNYVNHGPWKMFDRNGNVIAYGSFDMGKRIGQWTRWHTASSTRAAKIQPFNRFKAPFVSTASFKNGVMHGDWIILDSEERKIRQISIANGRRHGTTITWMPNGEILRQASYKNGLPDGEVVELKKSGTDPQRVANYVNGRKVTSKTANFSRSRQRKSVEMYLDRMTVQTQQDSFWGMTFAEFKNSGEPVLHGISQHWHPNGQLASEGEYNNGKKVGRFTYWHANGQKRSTGEFGDDLHTGLWVWWHDNGLKSAMGGYTAGAENGQWFWWKADGRLERKQMFDGSDQVRAATKPAKKSSSR